MKGCSTPLKLRSAIDTAAGRDEMILGNWQRLAAAAWKGFLDEGRGALLLNLKAAHEGSRWSVRKLGGLLVRAVALLIGSENRALINPGVTVQSEYLPIDVLRSGDGFEEMINYVENYDPTRGIVLFIVSGDGDVVRCRSLDSEVAQGLNPPDAYQAERRIHRNDPHSS